MAYTLLADMVLLLHALFVLFVVFGGVLTWVSSRWLWLHLPVLGWGVAVEWMGWICPLTPLERWLRQMAANGVAEHAGVIEPHLMPLIYPAGLTRSTQWLLGVTLILFNVIVYAVWWRRRKRLGQIPPPPR